MRLTGDVGIVSRGCSVLVPSLVGVLGNTSVAVYDTGRSLNAEVQTPVGLQQKPNLFQSRFQRGTCGPQQLTHMIPAGSVSIPTQNHSFYSK